MSIREAQERAAMLGLSVWITEVVAIGRGICETSELMCVGFESADLSIAQAETWEDALDQATRIIFSA